jgi:TonB family protein
MAKSFLTHFSTVFFVHILLILGAIQLNHFHPTPNSLGMVTMKLQLASHVISQKLASNKPTAIPRPKKNVSVNNSPISTLSSQTQVPVTATDSPLSSQAVNAADALSLYKSELRAIIDQNKYYPPLSRRLGQTGVVVVAFTLLKDGHIIDVRIDQPSRYERLNHSALDAVRKVVRFKPIPVEIGENKMDIKVPVKFVTI